MSSNFRILVSNPNPNPNLPIRHYTHEDEIITSTINPNTKSRNQFSCVFVSLRRKIILLKSSIGILHRPIPLSEQQKFSWDRHTIDISRLCRSWRSFKSRSEFHRSKPPCSERTVDFGGPFSDIVVGLKGWQNNRHNWGKKWRFNSEIVNLLFCDSQTAVQQSTELNWI
jgi:hypothetical protein